MSVKIPIPVVEGDRNCRLDRLAFLQFPAELAQGYDSIVLPQIPHLRFKDARIEPRKARDPVCADPVIAQNPELR